MVGGLGGGGEFTRRLLYALICRRMTAKPSCALCCDPSSQVCARHFDLCK